MPARTGKPHELRAVFAKNLRDARIKAGVSQEQLAVLSGLEQSYLSNVENARRNISLDAIGAILDALQVEASTLLKR